MLLNPVVLFLQMLCWNGFKDLRDLKEHFKDVFSVIMIHVEDKEPKIKTINDKSEFAKRVGGGWLIL